MNAIPKALSMANPTHVAGCVATVAGVISSKLAFDAVANKIDDTVERDPRGRSDTLTEEEIDDYFKE